MSLPRPRSPLFVLGSLTLLSAYLALVYELALVMLLLGFLLSLFVIGLAVALIGAPSLSIRREHAAEVMAGEPLDVTLTVVNMSVARSALYVELADEIQKGADPERALIVSLSPAERASITYRTRLRRRGEQRIARAQLSSRFPFGLFERRWSVASASSLLVLPRPGRLTRDVLVEAPVAQADVPVAVRGGMGEFHGVREFHSEDNPRWIHWRTSARRGSLHVREFERETEKRVIVVLGQLDDIEGGVTLCATLADHYARRGYRVAVGVTGGRPAWVPYGTGPDHVRACLRALATATPGTGEPAWTPSLIRGAHALVVGRAPMERLGAAASIRTLEPSPDLVAEIVDG